ncbi:MAG: hypothetical protein DMG28_14360 [Acidobacteria bacterium]|nr:MAG: hypothetical protein DMG28_14360 [Acidobacteriota bacterium]
MMRRHLPALIAILILLWAVACKKPVGENEAIRVAVQKHLAARGTLDLSAMEIDVKQVDIDRDHAVAQVEFRAKQGGGSMQMAYTLDRQGDGWAVRAGTPSAGNIGHPTSGEAPLPAASPSGPTTAPPFALGDLPASHPPQPTKGNAPAPAKKQ